MAPYTSIKAAYSRLGSDYTHRIWETTNEDVFKVSVDSTGNQRFMLRAQYENRQRTGDGFEADALAEVGELSTMRHFDIADRDRTRFTFIGTAAVTSSIEINASAGVGRDEYTESQHGLLSFDSNQYSIGANIAPDDRFNLSASYGWEDYSSLQRSRTANDAVQQADPKRDWTTDYTGKVNYFEAGFDINAIERTMIRISGDWNKSNDTYLYGLVTGSPLAVPEQLPPVKNELLRAEIDLTYELSKQPPSWCRLLVRRLQGRRLRPRRGHDLRHRVSAGAGRRGADHERAAARLSVPSVHRARRVGAADIRMVKRRTFLDSLLGFGFLSTALSVLYPVWRFVIPPANAEPATDSIVAGKVSEFTTNAAPS